MKLNAIGTQQTAYSHELAILSYATVCLHPSVSLNNLMKKFVVNLVNIK